jgi:prephenate dehydrogenase
MSRPEKASPDISLNRDSCVAIAGLGLLGASLGLRLRQCVPGMRILGYARREASVQAAIERGMIDSGSTDPADVLPEADLTILCIPVNAIIHFARANAHLWRPGAVVTDVGSVKGEIVDGVRPVLNERGVHFIGSHPMAGSEKAGLEYAKADLYDGAVVFVTPVAGDDPAVCDSVVRLWDMAGARTRRIKPGEHDALVARTSHLLHLLAGVAVEIGLAPDDALLATAGGFRDFTRIASSSPDMWSQIFELNRTEVLAAIDDFGGELDRLRGLIVAADWDELKVYLSTARDHRDQWLAEWQQARSRSKNQV